MSEKARAATPPSVHLRAERPFLDWVGAFAAKTGRTASRTIEDALRSHAAMLGHTQPPERIESKSPPAKCPPRQE